MATPVSISSNALLLVGDKPIASFDEATDRARLCANLWPDVRDEVLRSHPWNCAVKRVRLLPDADAPAFDWSYQFTLPGDYLRTLSAGELEAEEDWLIESGKLLCNVSPLLLRYIFRNDNPATYDGMLVGLMTATMAARMAYPLTQSAALAQELGGRAEVLARRARAVDGQDDPPSLLGDNPLRDARLRV
jgi:hypothetical protein